MLPRKTLAILLTLCLVLAPTVGATWSIVLVDSATGEVAVGSATCLEGTDLRVKDLAEIVLDALSSTSPHSDQGEA